MNFHHVFRWCRSIRVDPVFLTTAARKKRFRTVPWTSGVADLVHVFFFFCWLFQHVSGGWLLCHFSVGFSNTFLVVGFSNTFLVVVSTSSPLWPMFHRILPVGIFHFSVGCFNTFLVVVSTSAPPRPMFHANSLRWHVPPLWGCLALPGTVVYVSTFCLAVPLPMTVYALAIIFNWEQKNQPATEAFVVVQTVVSYLGLFAVVWGVVGLQWLGMLELYNGVESLVTIMAAICCAITGSWGSECGGGGGCGCCGGCGCGGCGCCCGPTSPPPQHPFSKPTILHHTLTNQPTTSAQGKYSCFHDTQITRNTNFPPGKINS